MSYVSKKARTKVRKKPCRSASVTETKPTMVNCVRSNTEEA